MSDAGKLAHMFKVLSADVRVRIVQLLKDRALCVGALSARLGITQGAVSQHLRILREAGLAVGEKRGYYTHYRLNETTVKRWKDATERLLAMGDWHGSSKGEKPCVKRKRVVNSPTS